MCKVNLFLVGAAKSGTTSLWAYLKNQPEIFGTHDEISKEPAYFCALGYGMGLEGYHALYTDGWRAKYRIDASTAYLTSPESAARIYDYNPAAKIIIVLRNPVDRAYSLYNWMASEGYEWAPTFNRALALEEERVNKYSGTFLMPQYYWNYLYKRAGKYVSQVDRFSEMFKDQVLLIAFNDLVNRTHETLGKIHRFLGLDYEPSGILPSENPSVSTRHPVLTFAARKLNNKFYRLMVPNYRDSKERRDWLVAKVNRSGRPQPMTDAVRQYLQDYYSTELATMERKYGVCLYC